MESAAATASKKRQTLIRKPLSDRTNTITSLNPVKTTVKSLIVPSKILQSALKDPKYTNIDKRFEENNHPPLVTEVPSTPLRPTNLLSTSCGDPGLVRNPRKRKCVSTERIGEKGNHHEDVILEMVGSDSDGFSATTTPVRKRSSLLPISDDDVYTRTRAAIKWKGKEKEKEKEKRETANRQMFTKKPLSECTNTVISLNCSNAMTKILNKPSEILLSTLEDPKSTNTGTSVNKSTVEKSNNEVDQNSGSDDDPEWLRAHFTHVRPTILSPSSDGELELFENSEKRKSSRTKRIGEKANKEDEDANREKNGNGSDGFGASTMPVREQNSLLRISDDNGVPEPMTVYTSRQASKRRMGEEKMEAAKRQTLTRKPLLEFTNTITPRKSSKINTKIPIEPPKVPLSKLNVPKSTNIGTSINKSIGEKGNSHANQKCGSNGVDDPKWLTDDYDRRQAAAKRKGKAKMFDDSFSCPPVEKIPAIRDESSDSEDVELSKTSCIIPPEKEQEQIQRYEQYIEKQKAYFDEVDAFPLEVEEEVDCDGV